MLTGSQSHCLPGTAANQHPSPLLLACSCKRTHELISREKTTSQVCEDPPSVALLPELLYQNKSMTCRTGAVVGHSCAEGPDPH